MTLTEALADAMIAYGCVNPALPIDEVAAGILHDSGFRVALTEAIFGAIRDDMSEPGCGYIDFTWRPEQEGDDSDGGREARAWAEAIADHLAPEREALG